MPENNQPNSESFTRTQILSFMGITALILLTIAQLWQKLGKINIIPVKFSLQDFLTGVFIAGGIFIASFTLTKLWPEYRLSAEKYLNLIISPLVISDLIWVALLPGLSEELLFRGVMLPAFGYDWLALTISSIFFGILHWSEVSSWHYVLWAIIIGFLLGYSAYFTGNLLVPIVAHSLTNFISSFLWKMRQ